MSEVCVHPLLLELKSWIFIVKAQKRQSSAGILESVDHDVVGMKEVVMVSHNQDTINAIHKIVGF